MRTAAHFRYSSSRLGGEGHVVHIGQKRVVDLHHQSGIDDRLVFLAQRLGELEQEFFVVL